MNRRLILTAAPVALLVGTIPALAGEDPDAELHRLIAEYHAMADAHGEVGIGSPENRAQHARLDQIAKFDPQTMNGAVAKLRLGFDEDELEAMAEAAPLDRIGAASVRDVLRLLGRA